MCIYVCMYIRTYVYEYVYMCIYVYIGATCIEILVGVAKLSNLYLQCLHA